MTTVIEMDEKISLGKTVTGPGGEVQTGLVQAIVNFTYPNGTMAVMNDNIDIAKGNQIIQAITSILNESIPAAQTEEEQPAEEQPETGTEDTGSSSRQRRRRRRIG